MSHSRVNDNCFFNTIGLIPSRLWWSIAVQCQDCLGMRLDYNQTGEFPTQDLFLLLLNAESILISGRYQGKLISNYLIMGLVPEVGGLLFILILFPVDIFKGMHHLRVFTTVSVLDERLHRRLIWSIK